MVLKMIKSQGEVIEKLTNDNKLLTKDIKKITVETPRSREAVTGHLREQIKEVEAKLEETKDSFQTVGKPTAQKHTSRLETVKTLEKKKKENWLNLGYASHLKKQWRRCSQEKNSPGGERPIKVTDQKTTTGTEKKRHKSK